MRILSALVVLACAVTTANAQTFPNKAVQIIVPSSPGGISDTAARLVGEGLSKIWGQSVVVENRPGGGGSIGTGAAKRSAADGYTLLVTTNGEFALNPVIYPSLPYDPAKDFLPIVMATYNPIAVVANINAPYHTFEELMDAARKKPGSIPWASAGAGTWNHLAGEWMQLETKTKLLHVPYKGGGPASTAVAGGDVPIGLLSVSSVMPHLKSGRVKILAVTSKDRIKFNKEWPTVGELSGSKLDAVNWVAFFAPNGVPADVARKIQNDVQTVLKDPKFLERLSLIGIEPGGMPSQELIEQIKSDRAQAELVAKESGMKVE